jgi:hypothetical protein
MTRVQKLLVIMLLTALCAGAAYLIRQLEWEKVTRRTGMSGEALVNPYHAGTELMRGLGYPAARIKDIAQLNELPADASLLLANPERFGDAALRERLLGWVRRGGHLVLPLHTQMRDSAWLDALGVEIHGQLDTDKPTLAIEIEGKVLHADLGGAAVFRFTQQESWLATLDGWLVADDSAPNRGEDVTGEDDPADETFHFVTEQPEDSEFDTPTDTVAVYGRLPHGNGFITVGSTDLFTNGQIKLADHATLFARLMSLPDGVHPVYVILAPEYPSLLAWLMDHASHALLALLILLLACAWHFAPRFGPLRADPARARPGLREHLSACGAFMLRSRSHEALIAPLREEVEYMLTHLHNRYPDVDSIPALAEKISNIPQSEVHYALQPAPRNHSDFLRRCHTLAVLRLHCIRLSRATSVSGLPL